MTWGSDDLGKWCLHVICLGEDAGAKGCVFSGKKVSAGDEGHLVCEVGAGCRCLGVELVLPSFFDGRLEIAVEWLLLCAWIDAFLQAWAEDRNAMAACMLRVRCLGEDAGATEPRQDAALLPLLLAHGIGQDGAAGAAMYKVPLQEKDVQALQEQLLRERSERQRATQLCKAQDEELKRRERLNSSLWEQRVRLERDASELRGRLARAESQQQKEVQELQTQLRRTEALRERDQGELQRELRSAMKRVCLIRHGHSEHNYSTTKRVSWLGGLFLRDSPLTAVGRSQASSLGDELRSDESHPLRQVEVVISSPLSRAIETSLLIFGEETPPPRCISHLHTERCIFRCDTGRPAEELLTKFSCLEQWEGFSQLPAEWWPKDRSLWQEVTPTDRVDAFRRYLAQRPEVVLAVVGHAGFFGELAGKHMSNCEAWWQSYGDCRRAAKIETLWLDLDPTDASVRPAAAASGADGANGVERAALLVALHQAAAEHARRQLAQARREGKDREALEQEIQELRLELTQAKNTMQIRLREQEAEFQKQCLELKATRLEEEKRRERREDAKRSPALTERASGGAEISRIEGSLEDVSMLSEGAAEAINKMKLLEDQLRSWQGMDHDKSVITGGPPGAPVAGVGGTAVVSERPEALSSRVLGVLGVREFHVAKALLEGQEELGATAWDASPSNGDQESLSELVPSQWGPVHLFDLCLMFGHSDTALALATGGVTGCRLEYDHLEALPNERNADSFAEVIRWGACRCEGAETCSRCSWGFPVDKGIWMEDLDASLSVAQQAALKAAKRPLVSGILARSSRNEMLPFAMSEAAAARLLDIAILDGNVEAAANLAKTCEVRPLRRWRGNELWSLCKPFTDRFTAHFWAKMGISGQKLSLISAALLAGADFQGLNIELGGELRPPLEVPFLRFLALDFEPEQWQQLQQVLPQEKNRWPTSNMKLSGEFLSSGTRPFSLPWRFSMQKIQNAFRAGWDLKRIWATFKRLDESNRDSAAGLLDVAILCGQRDCADALASVGVELSVDCLDLHRWAFQGKSLLEVWFLCDFRLDQGSALECKSAAHAAAFASLKRSFQLEGVEKGIAVYQTLIQKFYPRGVPMALVRNILGFSMEPPKILDQLDLWDEVSSWMPSVQATTYGDGAGKFSEVEDLDVERGQQEQPSTQSAELRSDPPEVDVKTTDDLMTALQLSRDQVPVLNMDGVCVFRLTRMATSDHVARVLLDATGPLAELHRRVLEAGCEVDPEWKLGKDWNPVKALLVPITESQMAELQALAEHGYELSREDHILALQSDQDLITKALRQICHKNRPKLKKVGPEAAIPGDAPEDEPLLVLESGIRTDSDLGFPSYPTSSTESLAELVPSQWGQVHLFDLCLCFGHIDTALALASSGVKGCTLEDHHFRAGRDHGLCRAPCGCRSWKPCSLCCWGFLVDNGIWMKDWDTHLRGASDMAQEAAKMPLIRGILDLCSRNERLPFAVSVEAAARLLDIAILCGNVEASANLAKSCEARPLRRWRGCEMYWEEAVSILSAALSAGANFEGLYVVLGGEEVPLLRAVALDCEPEQWQQLAQFFLPKGNAWPTCTMRVGEFFLWNERGEDGRWRQCVSTQKIRNALRAGWDLKHMCADELYIDNLCCDASLLDLAILCGQRDCAGALASAGSELSVHCLDWHRRALRGENLRHLRRVCSQGSALECQSAASAATFASFTRSFKREGAEKGIVVYQTLTKKFRPRGVPMALVHDILDFSMDVPKIIDQLDLWDEVSGWNPPSAQRTAPVEDIPPPVLFFAPMAGSKYLEVEEQHDSESIRDPGTPNICQHFFVVFPLD
eukprot:s45_g32.t1